MTTNQLRWLELQEARRRNLASEHETHRSNVAKEGLTQFQNLETQRSNMATEAETARANQAREAETNRSNVARELETNRTNVAHETETHRANVASENIKQDAHQLNVYSTIADNVQKAWSNWNNARANDTRANQNFTKLAGDIARTVLPILLQ